MTALATAAGRWTISRPGALFCLIGAAGLALPFVEFRANRIVPGEGLSLPGVLGPLGWSAAGLLFAALIAGLWAGLPQRARLALMLTGTLLTALALGAAASAATPEGDRIARVSPGSGFWLLFLAFSLSAADAVARLSPSPRVNWLLLAGTVMAVAALLSSGWLNDVSVMREYAARSAVFWREAARHLALTFGSLGAALAVGLPLGILIHEAPRLRPGVLSVLNIVQTIPSLALFGIMIPLFGWIAASLPGAAALGISGIGAFPAFVALFLYALLPIVSNMLTGLLGVAPPLREAAAGLGMTRAQMMVQVLIPLTLPMVLAAVRIVLVQSIGLAVIAGLIGGGGFGTFVFQGLNQTAMDLILLGALPTIALALFSGAALDLLVAQMRRGKAGAA